jgi:phosphopantetheinyl transferase
MGCDLEKVEPRTWSFVRDYFTPNEQDAVAAQGNPELRARMVTLIWSAKEAVLKALETGLRADTRTLSVSFEGDATLDRPLWQSLTVCTSNSCFNGWWKEENEFVYCFASNQPPAPPRVIG